MAVFPGSLIEFQRRFPTDEACGEYLVAVRWPQGFCCPACGHDRGWRLERRLPTFECAGCDRQTSVTAGTVMHRSHLPLTTWFWAAYLMATHSNGISALQLQGQLGIGSYKTAWLLARKLRRAMVDPARLPLAGLVEVDETSLPQRTKDDPPGGGHGRSGKGRMKVVAAVEVEGRRPRRLRLAALADYSATSLHAFIAEAVAPDATIRTDAWQGYSGAPVAGHDPRTVGAMAAHLVLPWTHRVFSNLKRPRRSPDRRSFGHRIIRLLADDGRWAPITACAVTTCRLISTSSSSASIAATTAMPPSTASSVSPPCCPMPATRCWSSVANGISHR